MGTNTVTLDIFIHMDAANRNEWTGAPDDRPLTDLGRQQAARIAEELTAEPVHGLFSSPAVRCTESMAPLTEATGLPVVVLPGFRDTKGYRAPAGWEKQDQPGNDPLGGAASAGSAFAALKQITAALPEGGRAVLCSYGDIVPALLAFLSGLGDVEMPARNNQKGAVYTVRLDAGKVALSLRPSSEGFPQ